MYCLSFSLIAMSAGQNHPELPIGCHMAWKMWPQDPSMGAVDGWQGKQVLGFVDCSFD